MMSSWVLEGLRRRLSELAQENKCSSSAGRLKELEDGAASFLSVGKGGGSYYLNENVKLKLTS